MFDLNDYNDIVAFKKRLSDTRKEKGFTQESFAEALHFGDRSRIANWESKKSRTLLHLGNFTTVCDLLDVDPNYLLGKSDIDSSNDQAISDVVGLSRSNIQQLRSSEYISKFFNYMLSSSKMSELFHRMKQICYYGFISEVQETTFLPESLKKIERAFEKFYREVFPLDMNIELFTKYIKAEFPWNPDKISFDELITSTISQNEYNNILYEYPDFEEKLDSEKYSILIKDIAATSYDYMIDRPIIELAEYEISSAINDIVKSFIYTEISNFKKRDRKPSE